MRHGDPEEIPNEGEVFEAFEMMRKANREQAAHHERRRIVAWLYRMAESGDEIYIAIARSIEREEHLK